LRGDPRLEKILPLSQEKSNFEANRLEELLDFAFALDERTKKAE
jgi:hypothetical protein